MTISDLPGDLGGSHPLRNWLNRLKRAILRRTLLAGIGYKVRQTESGVILEILPGAGGSPAAPSETAAFLLQSVFSDTPVPDGRVIACKKLTGGETGTAESTTTYVARSYKLRPVSQRLIGGVLWNYVYSVDFTFRVASASNQPSENQVIIPYYIPPYGAGTVPSYPAYSGDIIYARKLATPLFSINTGTAQNPVLQPVTWLDCNEDGRAWAKADDL